MGSDAPEKCESDKSKNVPLKPAARFAMIDGLRGLAALGIAVYHIWRYQPAWESDPQFFPAAEIMPEFVDWVFRKSWIGVQFLLVLSGFVIAFTLRNTWVSPRELFSFVARRAVRLWPPYAVTVLFAAVLLAVCESWWGLPAPVGDPLTVVRVLSHLGFLQDVLEQTPLTAAIWTVCIEMQFYVVSVVGWGLAQRLLTRPDPQLPRPSGWGVLLVFAPLALASLHFWNPMTSTEPWVIHFLNAFFLGMVTWWTLDRTVSARVFAATVIVVAGHLVWQWKLENALALIAALSIYVAGRTDHLHDWLNWRWLQYLGKISYSLYLIHYPVSHLLTFACWRWCGGSPTPVQANLILLLCLAASIAAGHLLYACVEAPSGRCSTWLKNRRPAP